MEILISVAAKIAEYTVAPIGRQVGYLFSYKNNFKELIDQVKELEIAREDIKSLVEVEERKGRKIVVAVKDWLGKVDETINNANQLHEDPRREMVGCTKYPFANLWQRHQLSRKAKKVTKDVLDVKGKGKFERDKIAYVPALGGVGSTSAICRFVDLESRMSIMDKIMQALADPKISILGIYGFGGVGKSTLVEQVARKAKFNIFDEVVMAFVTRSPDLQRIQGEIADQLGIQFTESTMAGRAYRLREALNLRKNILIILDDIWAIIKLEDIGIPYRGNIKLEERKLSSRDDHKGCKILITSRNQDLLHEMESQKNFGLKVLNEKETWKLFAAMAGDIANNSTYEGIAGEVAKKCAGLPVLIVPVARALKNKGIPVWKNALSKLARVDNKELHEITYSALELSYSQLDGDEVKALFLLCGVIQCHAVEYLLKCVLGLGIFKHVNTVEDARTRLDTMISALKASCLLLDDSETSLGFEMHDIVHDVAISIAIRDECVFIRKQNFELKEWPTKDFLKRCSKIILFECNIQKLPERLDCPELEFFDLTMANNPSLEIPDSFFEGMRKLKVLDLTCMNISSMPTSICNLSELQTLCLDQSVLGDIAIIGALKNLKVLSLVYSSMVELPSEIGKLTNLRMLDMRNSKIAVIPPNTISSLTALEELYMGDASIEWEVSNSANQRKNASLAELRQLPNLSALDVQIGEVWNLPRDLLFDKLEKYKILIGDVWEWTDNYGTSTTLKLKLPTSIHLEHGIKALTKRVESLCMDEVGGISNVLYQLNGEGFPQLKHLHIQNNMQIQHIINLEWNQACDSFPNLETMVLHNLNKLEKLCHGLLSVNSLSKLKVIKVKNCHQLKYLFSHSMVKRLPQLIDIEVSECNSMREVVFVENYSIVADNGITDTIEFCRLQSLTLQNLPMVDGFCSNELTKENDKRLPITYISDPFFTMKVAFPYLETMKLSSINLHKIWDDDQLSDTCAIQNLTTLIMENCGNLKHLFSYSMIGSLSKLKQLEISKCHMMEEIIYTGGGRNNGLPLKLVQFPTLEKIVINDMKKLRTVWHCQFDGLRSMVIDNCEKLVCIFPSYMQRNLHSLETLTVRNCGSVKEIFELDANKTSYAKDMTELRELTLVGLPKLKQIWSMEAEEIVRFHNLQAVHVESCDNLEYLFPLSIASRLPKIEVLELLFCPLMKTIVEKKEEMEGTARFVLNKLTSLYLNGMHFLRGFYAGNYTLSCPSLKKIDVFNCENLMLFMTQSINYQEVHDVGKLGISLQQPLFTVQEVIPNLEKLSLDSNCASMILQDEFPSLLVGKLKILRVSEFEDKHGNFPDWFLRNVPSLEILVVEHSVFKEVFQDKIYAVEEGRIQSSTRVKSLSLFSLPKLQHICKEGFQIDPVLEVLETLHLMSCSSLINLVPSSVTFSFLTFLEVRNCNGLIKLITSTTAKSLVKLEKINIEECNLLEEIVTGQEDEAKDRIAFINLKILELICLPQLNKFCSSKCFIKFPLLWKVVVRQCPRMEIFSLGDTSTPNLRKVQVNDEEGCWEGNINGTIQKMFNDKVSFRSFKRLNLTEFPELNDLWYGPSMHNMFQSLRSLVVHNCDFLSDVLFTSNLLQLVQNLEDLEVKDCDSVEAVFDVKSMDDKGLMKQTAQMKNLTVSGLPKLKHIWNKDPQEIISFRNLRAVQVTKCARLEYLFSFSLCQDLELLEDLHIESCGVVEIVSKKEGFEECRFHFPHLTIMRLWYLSKLNSFYPGNHTLECPSLKELYVYHCEALQKFDFNCSDFLQLHQMNRVDIPVQQALFSFEKVCTRLETLALNSKDVKAIQNGQHHEDIFDKIEVLRLHCFHETPAIFPIDFLQRFSNPITLIVRCSSFHTIFPREGVGHHHSGTSVQVEELWLDYLEKLVYIWNEDNQSNTVVHLKSSELNLTPSSFSFKNLIRLCVKDCKALIYLFTSSMAKSLVQLRRVTIVECETMQYVMKINEEVAEEEITFENLEYLKLSSLPSFRGFCSGKCRLIFSSLLKLEVIGCPRMKLFSPGVIITPMLRTVEVEDGRKCWNGDLNTTIKQLFVDKVVPNLEKLQLDSKDVMTIWQGQYPEDLFHNIKTLNLECFHEQSAFPSHLLERFPHLEKLEVSQSSFEILFPREGENDHYSKMPARINQLRFEHLSQLKYIWNQDSQLVSLVQNLKSLEVICCSNLEKLAPTSLSFPNLTTLMVDQCDGLVNLVTSSIAKSFVQLKTMRIQNCKMMEEIVGGEGDEEDDEIAFDCLALLELSNLDSLKSFCSQNNTFKFPSLTRITVKDCPKMDIFCPGVLVTPMLEAVETEDRNTWENNLNATIKHMFMQKDIPQVDCR